MRSTKQSIILFVAVLAATPGVLPAAAVTAPRPVALTGNAAPGGGTYGSLSFGLPSEAPTLNASGQVAFKANVTGGPYPQGFFAGVPGSVAAVAFQNGATPAGGTYSSLFGSPVLSESGRAAFHASFFDDTNYTGIFAGAPGSVAVAAVQGGAAPAGGAYNNFLTPVLNGSGQVAFGAFLTGGSSASGIFAGAPGSVAAAALQGDAAPSGGNYNTFGSSSEPIKATMNASGQVAFVASLTGGTSTSGIFTGAPGSIATAARTGTAAPGGGTFAAFQSPAINDAGQVAFQASILNAASGIFVGAPGALAAAARNGTAAPAGGNYSFFTPAVAVNGAGQVAFSAGLTGGTSPQGLFVGAPGSVAAAALIGDAAPGGGTYSSFNGSFALNDAGQLAFLATLTGGDTTLFAGTPGDMAKVVRRGDVIDVDPGPGVLNRTVTGINLALTSGGQDGRGMSFNDDGLLIYSLSFNNGTSGVFTSVVPEPAAMSLCALAGAGLLLRRRHCRRPSDAGGA